MRRGQLICSVLYCLVMPACCSVSLALLLLLRLHPDSQALRTMSSSRVSQHIARISHDALLGGGLITSSSTTSCSRAFLRDGIQLQLRYQARHRQYSSIARSSILESQKPSSGDTLIRLKWSNSKNSAGGGSRSNRYGGGRHYHHSSRGGSSSSSSRKASSIQGAKWLLLPFSLSKIHLDEDHTLKERAQEFYEHARDLTLNEKSSLLEEGDHELSLWDRFLTSIHRWIIEPLGTARRFLYLAFLFLPVIATAPLLALELSNDQSSGSSSKRKKGGHPAERATTRWWYGFLVKQMERAGPTFIKVSLFLVPFIHDIMLITCPLTACSVGRIPSRSLPRYIMRYVRQTALKRESSLFAIYKTRPRESIQQAFR